MTHDDERCATCGEPFDDDDARAEVYSDLDTASRIVHAECMTADDKLA
jgi:hypothetical protein